MILSSLKELVRERADEVLKKRGAAAPVPSFDLSVPPPRVPGDLAANVALVMAKPVGANPRALAEEMASGFPASPLLKKVEIAGPGFLNFWLSDAAYEEALQALNGADTAPKPKSATKTLLEFVSANPTGPLHVGHGRGAALGDSLARILRYLGQDVTTEFYINDAGGQIRKLGLSVEARLKEIKGEPVTFPEDGYKGSYVKDIAEDILKTGATLSPVKPDQMVFSTADLAGFASARILQLIKETLERFGVTFDRYFSESTLHKGGAVLALIDELRKKNLVYDQDGATWFKATDYGDEKDRVLQKANEAPTYFASDIAYHADKVRRGYDRLINIWGADHHGYAQRLKGALTALGLPSEKLNIVFNQLVSIKGGRLSKRAGDMITLQELVDEVGKDAARFFFALRSPGAHFEFDLDLAKKQAPDNPVYYVQYVHARCCSIFREAEKRGFGDSAGAAPRTEAISEVEKSVVLHLLGFDAAVELCAKDATNHHLTVYLLELAGKYHSFYEKCHVLVEDAGLRRFRLALVDAIRRRVAQGLDLLGVSAPTSL